MLAGFLYATVLYFSMMEKPKITRFIVGMVILGVLNLFVVYANVIMIFLPDIISFYLFYLSPSLIGALITLLILKKLWRIKISIQQSKTILIFIVIGSLINPLLMLIISRYIHARGLPLLLNCIVWWVAFSLGIIILKRSKCHKNCLGNLSR